MNWDTDYCYFTPVRVGKAAEISISLEIVPPPSFINRTPVIWKKTWRRQGIHSDEYEHTDGTSINPKSKVVAFLRSMRFDYVPAIKGQSYFRSLMAKLYDMLEATVEEKVRNASKLFTDTINENTLGIREEISKRINLQSTIQLPSDLRELFGQLEFTSTSPTKSFSLQQRGDGIKVRHIPIVLRWLSEQVNHLSAPGKPKSVTIWGYEEPENNLELRRCFELAKEFVDDCAEIQSFVTTHSPAFYSVFRESDASKVALFLVAKNQTTEVSEIKPLAETDMHSLDSAMGLLGLLEPHFKEARQELSKLRTTVKNLHDTSKATIFCEGPTDKLVYEESLRLFFPKQALQINVRNSSHHGGGFTWVVEMLIAWSYSRPTAIAVGVFDKDDGAQKALKDMNQKLNVPPSGKKAFGVTLVPGNEVKLCLQRKVTIPFAIEELFPEDVWTFAESKNWLEERANLIPLYKFKETNVTFDDYLAKTLPESHLLRMALKKVRTEDKENLAKHVCYLEPEEERKRVLYPLKPTIQECLVRLGIPLN